MLGGKDDSRVSTMSGACIQYMKYATKQFCQPSSGDRRAKMQDFTKRIDDLPFLVYVIEHSESHITKECPLVLKQGNHETKVCVRQSGRLVLYDWR